MSDLRDDERAAIAAVRASDAVGIAECTVLLATRLKEARAELAREREKLRRVMSTVSEAAEALDEPVTPSLRIMIRDALRAAMEE